MSDQRAGADRRKQRIPGNAEPIAAWTLRRAVIVRRLSLGIPGWVKAAGYTVWVPRKKPVRAQKSDVSHIIRVRAADYSAAMHKVSQLPHELIVTSRPEEFHLRALPEPCMTLSSHTAPDVRPLP